jgi:imidazolonepropionase-like amidohydrolase
VRMVVGDDFGTPIMPHGDYIPELELYVKKLGVSPLEVLRWATKNGAEAMGLGDRTGTIAVGKLADLIVVDGDPLTDVACLANRDNLRVILLGGKVMKDTF